MVGHFQSPLVLYKCASFHGMLPVQLHEDVLVEGEALSTSRESNSGPDNTVGLVLNPLGSGVQCVEIQCRCSW